MKIVSRKWGAYRKVLRSGMVAASVLLVQVALWAQDGNAGINEANTRVRSYFDSGINLMYAVGASTLR